MFGHSTACRIVAELFRHRCKGVSTAVDPTQSCAHHACCCCHYTLHRDRAQSLIVSNMLGGVAWIDRPNHFTSAADHTGIVVFRTVCPASADS